MSLFSEHFRFALPAFLAALILVPFILLLLGRKGADSGVIFSGFRFLWGLGKPTRARWGGLSNILPALSLTSAILALAGPERLRQEEKKSSEGIEMIMALDVSRSMGIKDFSIGGERVTRLAAAKKVTRDFIGGRISDRIGVVAFAGRPYLASPLTLDHGWLQNSIERIRIGLVEDGTAIGSAIAMGARRLDQRESKSKVLILLTDGASNSGNLTPKDAALLAKTIEIKIHTIAVGTPGVHPIPMAGGTFVHRQEFDIDTLKSVSEIGEGQFYRAEDTDSLKKIFGQIDQMEKSETETITITESSPLFIWFIAFSAGVLFVHILLAELIRHTQP